MLRNIIRSSISMIVFAILEASGLDLAFQGYSTHCSVNVKWIIASTLRRMHVASDEGDTMKGSFKKEGGYPNRIPGQLYRPHSIAEIQLI